MRIANALRLIIAARLGIIPVGRRNAQAEIEARTIEIAVMPAFPPAPVVIVAAAPVIAIPATPIA
jgi:hypothetical protein